MPCSRDRSGQGRNVSIVFQLCEVVASDHKRRLSWLRISGSSSLSALWSVTTKVWALRCSPWFGKCEIAVPDHFAVLVDTKYSRNSRNVEFVSSSLIAKKCVIRSGCNPPGRCVRTDRDAEGLLRASPDQPAGVGEFVMASVFVPVDLRAIASRKGVAIPPDQQ